MFVHKRPWATLKTLPILVALSMLFLVAPAGATSPVTTAALLPTALHANTTSTLTINGTNLSGATVTTTSPELITLGTVTQVSNVQLTVQVTVGTFTGPSPTSANITVTGDNVVSDSLVVDPDPTVTGTYYAAPSSTNLEMTVTGNYFGATAVTASSSNPIFSVNVVSTAPSSVALLVSTTAAAVDGTSSNITFTDPDGSSVTFVLHGGAPVSKPALTLVPAALHAGTSSVLTINGGPFVAGATVTTTTPYVVSLGATTVVSSTQITVPVVVDPITGATSVIASITVTNPDTGTGTANLTVEADPTTTGTYFVAPTSTNTEITITGTNFSSSGVTAASSNSAFSVVVVSSSSGAVILLVSTSALAGATTNVTLTNPDGSSAVVLLTAGTAAVTVVKPAVIISPSALHAGLTSLITITGGPFASGATVTTSTPELVSVGTVTFVSTTELTASVTIASITGGSTTGSTLTVTNPDKGVGTATLSIEPDPSVPGTYSVPAPVTNYELTVTGSELSATDMTATSSNPDFSVSLVSSSTSSVSLLVTTTSAAAAGETSTVTLTNPDGSKATFTLKTSASSTTTTTTTLPSTTTTTTLPSKGTPITATINLFKNKLPGTTVKGRALLEALAKRIASSGDTTVTLDSYVTGLSSSAKDQALAAVRATVAAVNLRSDLRLLHSKATVSTAAFVGPTRTHIVAS